jgi:hypothetical protein
MSKSFADPEDEPRLILHAGMTNMYFVMITMSVIMLVTLASEIFRIWREGAGREPVGFFLGAALVLIPAIAYLQKKARWLIARPSGLTIIERSRTRVVPWRDVGVVDDLGYWGGGPGAKRYYLELRDGYFFTFLGDPMQMARLQELREDWTRRSVAERSSASSHSSP